MSSSRHKLLLPWQVWKNAKWSESLAFHFFSLEKMNTYCNWFSVKIPVYDSQTFKAKLCTEPTVDYRQRKSIPVLETIQSHSVTMSWVNVQEWAPIILVLTVEHPGSNLLGPDPDLAEGQQPRGCIVIVLGPHKHSDPIRTTHGSSDPPNRQRRVTLHCPGGGRQVNVKHLTAYRGI